MTSADPTAIVLHAIKQTYEFARQHQVAFFAVTVDTRPAAAAITDVTGCGDTQHAVLSALALVQAMINDPGSLDVARLREAEAVLAALAGITQTTVIVARAGEEAMQ